MTVPAMAGDRTMMHKISIGNNTIAGLSILWESPLPARQYERYIPM